MYLDINASKLRKSHIEHQSILSWALKGQSFLGVLSVVEIIVAAFFLDVGNNSHNKTKLWPLKSRSIKELHLVHKIEEFFSSIGKAVVKKNNQPIFFTKKRLKMIFSSAKFNLNLLKIRIFRSCALVKPDNRENESNQFVFNPISTFAEQKVYLRPCFATLNCICYPRRAL